MNFIGRKNELKILKKMYDNDAFEGILIYGRRRIGKSELINYSMNNSKLRGIYFECVEASEETNLSILSKQISDSFKIENIKFATIFDALNFVFKKSYNEKIILAIDEYPYLRKIYGIDSIISHLIDNHGNKSKLKLIISGSQIDIMSALLGHDNPLYGRINITLPIKQQDYYDSSLFYNNYSPSEKVMIYSVFGGVPFYNKFIDDSISVKENIINLIASPLSRFLPEIELRLKTEIKKMENANEVFMALAKGKRKYSDILNASHVSSSPAFVDTLDKLQSLELIKKISPINDEKSIKKSLYLISDNLSNFYYRYIYKNSSIFKTMNPNDFYDEFIKEDFEKQYVPKIFEIIFKQYLQSQNKERNIKPPLHKIGTYYYDDKINKSNGQFDVVSLDNNGYIFYEVKFTKDKIGNSEINEELKQISKTNIKPYKYGFVSKSGFKDDVKKSDSLIFYLIDDLYE